MKRYKHSLSHYHLTTMDMGKLYPVGVLEVLPGDSFRQRTDLLIRTPALTKPIMHPVSVRIHHFFVPNRIVWSGWEDFITGAVDETTTPIPTITVAGPGEDLAHQMGIGFGSHSINALPIRAFNKIYNEYYRDQDLITERSEDDTTIPSIAWEKDYFTASRPWPQKGTAVTIPIGTSAPIVSDGQFMLDEDGNGLNPTNLERSNGGAGTALHLEDAGSAGGTNLYYNSGLEADLTGADAIDVRDFREAFALQRYQEARARYGDEYVDYLRYCGIRPSDARLQRPEYLGGGKNTISFSEVLQTGVTSNGTDAGVGNLSGHGIGAMRSNRYTRFFEEHGWVLSLCSIRPKSMYTNRIPRKFTRATKEDYFQKELQDIGQQEVLNREVYGQHTSPTDTFGYANRYHEYTDEQSYTTGMMNDATTGNQWHLGRVFSSDPTLNQSFIECNPSDRAWQTTSEDQLQVMVQHSVQARRMVRSSNVGRII